jgi:rfaE bifunctional protein nucleotidyltransferase chain/domain
MKLITIENLEEKLRELRQATTIGQCHGCFDLLHPGHIRHLQDARKRCAVLVVSVTSDRHIHKGPGRPVHTAEERAFMISALSCVDFVVVDDNPNAVNAIRRIRPHLFFKGVDYSEKDTIDPMERTAVEGFGGTVVYTMTPKQSTTDIINRIKGKSNGVGGTAFY